MILLQSVNSCKNKNLRLKKSPDELLAAKIQEFFIKHPKDIADLEKSIKEDRKRKPYKDRRWGGHSYGTILLHTVTYHIQAYYFSYGIHGNKVRPSRKRLAKELGICVETLDKALRVLRDMGVIFWDSGKKTWETNVYHLAECYLTTPMRHPENGYRHPHHLYFKLHSNRRNKKFQNKFGFARIIYEHLLRDIRHHILRINEWIRAFEERKYKKFLEEALNPRKTRGPPILKHLLKPFSFSFRDCAILSSFGEATLYAAINDIAKYKEWGKEVSNDVAFLISRCKSNKELIAQKRESYEDCTPDEAVNWIKGVLTSKQGEFAFLKSTKEIDRSGKTQKPQILLRIAKSSPAASILRIYHKIEGLWVDQEFTFQRPDFKQVVFDYFESLFSTKAKFAG